FNSYNPRGCELVIAADLATQHVTVYVDARRRISCYAGENADAVRQIFLTPAAASLHAGIATGPGKWRNHDLRLSRWDPKIRSEPAAPPSTVAFIATLSAL